MPHLSAGRTARDGGLRPVVLETPAAGALFRGANASSCPSVRSSWIACISCATKRRSPRSTSPRRAASRRSCSLPRRRRRICASPARGCTNTPASSAATDCLGTADHGASRGAGCSAPIDPRRSRDAHRDPRRRADAVFPDRVRPSSCSRSGRVCLRPGEDLPVHSFAYAVPAPLDCPRVPACPRCYRGLAKCCGRSPRHACAPLGVRRERPRLWRRVVIGHAAAR
jgi:hypothetical protein